MGRGEGVGPGRDLRRLNPGIVRGSDGVVGSPVVGGPLGDGGEGVLRALADEGHGVRARLGAFEGHWRIAERKEKVSNIMV